MKNYKLDEKNFLFFKSKDKFNRTQINFIIYTNTNFENNSVYIFIEEEKNKIVIDYLGRFTLEIKNLKKEFIRKIKDHKKVYITEIDVKKRRKPFYYIGKVIK